MLKMDGPPLDMSRPGPGEPYNSREGKAEWCFHADECTECRYLGDEAVTAIATLDRIYGIVESAGNAIDADVAEILLREICDHSPAPDDEPGERWGKRWEKRTARLCDQVERIGDRASELRMALAELARLDLTKLTRGDGL
ncbi:MAG TPA: hypothetical protein VFJ24_01585 [Gaiellales bacterium]|nr:hypothetical protein [Gaiellales bacterium]